MLSLRKMLTVGTLLTAVLFAGFVSAEETKVIPSVRERFTPAETTEVPDFQKHFGPLLGRLGCNGRACHGSFQGRGGFQLSLFGYDFEVDRAALFERVDTDSPLDSYALQKATLSTDHEGGQRMEVGSWEYNLFLSWIKGGAKGVDGEPVKLERLELTPPEIQFTGNDQKQQLKAVAVWADGSREDVTCLCRFQSNDDSICKVDQEGLVTSGDMGDSHVVVFYDTAVVPVPILRPVSDLLGDQYPQVAAATTIDELVIQKLAKLGITPSDKADDAEFLRRVHLDITGTLPTAEEVRKFLADTSETKRAAKVDELLETPAYAAWWTTRMCDWTGCSDQQLNNVNSVTTGSPSQDWYQWIYKRVEANVPYDQIVEGIVLAKGRKDDESYMDYYTRLSKGYHDKDPSDAYAENPGLTYFWGRRNFNTTEDRAIGFAYTFMGTRIQCAQCHKHPFDVWTKKDFEQFEKFFAAVKFDRGQSKEAKELIKKLDVDSLKGNDQRRKLGQLLQDGAIVPFPDIAVSRTGGKKGKDGEVAAENARLLGEQTVNLAAVADPRDSLMDWLRNSPTKLFAKALVNRVWANYFNRGIVEPTDNMAMANPPSNAPLLDYLADGFIAHNYDMKWLHREICLSDTYQRSWKPNDTNMHDERNFSRAVPRRLPAEAAYDALVMASASSEDAAKFEEELKNRALMASSPPRNNGNGNSTDYALRIFGRSIRESNCDCDRSEEASLLQTVYVRNDADVLKMIDRTDGWVAEVMKQSSSSTDTDRDAKQLASFEKRLTDLEKQISKTDNEKKRGSLKAQAEKLTGQIAELKEKLKPAEPAPLADTSLLIEEAYLRTLSRFPTADEKAIADKFLTEAQDHTAGVRDLLWALLNTKEFMVNH